MMGYILRFRDSKLGIRLGYQVDEMIADLTEVFPTLTAWLRNSSGRVPQAIAELDDWFQQAERLFHVGELIANQSLLAPIDHQEVWAAGVTYERSRSARQEEAIDGGDFYARVYAAERPEIFFKSTGARVSAPFQAVGIRADAAWSVPEPELGVVLNPRLEVVGFTIGNDMSSRDIEGANPLYLPQAKIYSGSCALGPAIWLHPFQDWPDLDITLKIERSNQVVFTGAIRTSRIHRSLPELVGYLGRCNHFPSGVVFLSGTGIIPPGQFTLEGGDQVTIAIEGLGQLVNPVEVVPL
jgi:2-dehydro-3-deoxy-D-arabinonate dehydratase